MTPASQQETELVAATDAKKNGSDYRTFCPSHEDKSPSLDFREKGGKLLFNCRAGCPSSEVFKAIRDRHPNVFPKSNGHAKQKDPHGGQEWRIVDADGITVAIHKRMAYLTSAGKKSVVWYRGNGKKGLAGRKVNTLPLYGLPSLLEAKEKQDKPLVVVTEGERAADAARHLMDCAAVGTVTGADGLPEDEHLVPLVGCQVILWPDADYQGTKHMTRVAERLRVLGLPPEDIKIIDWENAPEKGDAADYSGKANEAYNLIKPLVLPGDEPHHESKTLAEVHRTARKWLGNDYDLDVLNAVLATAAAERLTGDPLWLLVLGGSGDTKTETVQSLAGIGAHITSTLSSEAALLSGTSKKDSDKDATGGLLKTIGERGILVLKDFTSILSMDRHARAALLAAFREIHDGKWTRDIGGGGGKRLSWEGRLVVVGACTTAWDTHHTVTSSMGDRFVLVRQPKKGGRARRAQGLQAMGNVGHEVEMRAELAEAAGGLISTVTAEDAVELADTEKHSIIDAANVVTLCRTAVEMDYQGNVEMAHAPEAPTRFSKQLVQLFRGGVAIGLSRLAALHLTIRCARDSMPPLRLNILEDLVAHHGSSATEVAKRLSKPRKSVDRQLQGLHYLGAVVCGDVEEVRRGRDGEERTFTIWRYSASEEVPVSVISAEPKQVEVAA